MKTSKRNVNHIVILITSFFLITACSSVQHKEQEILARGNSISELKGAIEQAEASELGIYMPKAFQKTKAAYASALAKAEISTDNSAGISEAKEALRLLALAENKSKRSKEVLALAYSMRSRALNADAGTLYPDRAKDAEQALVEAAKLVELGEEQQARVNRDEVIGLYTSLEVDSLKKGTTALAKKAYQDALTFKADDYAPKSFDLAEKEIALTEKVIEIDKSEVDKARFHAERSKYLAERAKQIAIIVKSFERRDFSHEDIVLWYHSQLDKLAKPLETSVQYNKSNSVVIEELVNQIAYFKSSISEGVASQKKKQEQINELEDKIASMLSTREKADFIREQQAQRFIAVRNLFSSDEARVYRIEDGVLIKVHGFYFNVGESNLEVQNYPLIKKIIDAIGQFPKANSITITGHTDATGSNSINLKLSKQRAQNVKALLISIGEISGDKIQTFGFGETKPVKSNNTKEGRALNRRIEIKIH